MAQAKRPTCVFLHTGWKLNFFHEGSNFSSEGGSYFIFSRKKKYIKNYYVLNCCVAVNYQKPTLTLLKRGRLCSLQGVNPHHPSPPSPLQPPPQHPSLIITLPTQADEHVNMMNMMNMNPHPPSPPPTPTPTPHPNTPRWLLPCLRRLLMMKLCEILFNVDLIELISELSLLSLTIKFKLKIKILAGNWDKKDLVHLTLYIDTKLFTQ